MIKPLEKVSPRRRHARPAYPSKRAKRAFDIDEAVARIEKAIHPLPKAAMFELAERGYNSLFQQLVACIISIRTRDEVTVPTACRLFATAKDPADVLSLTEHEIDEHIQACTFHRAKAKSIRKIAERAVQDYNGKLPCDRDLIVSLPGVGPKCGGLALGIACGQRHIGVDIHVHRVTNRWGYVSANTPEKTMSALEETLPHSYWIEINRLLVPFGKHICTFRLPHCSTCPVLDMCQQVGVTEHR